MRSCTPSNSDTFITRQNFYFLDLHNSFIIFFVFHFAILMIIICDHNGVIFFIYIYIKYSAFSVLDVELLLGLWSYKVYPLMNSICRGLKKVQKFFQRGRSTGLAANHEKLFRQALIWRQKFEFTQPWFFLYFFCMCLPWADVNLGKLGCAP